jgi:plastocyanin
VLKRFWVLPMLGVLGVALLAAACGGGGNNNTPTATRPAATATPRATASPAATPKATTTPAATATPKATATPAATATPKATATPAATATPTAGATQIDVTAQNTAFDKTTIQVTAGQPFTIILNNKDSMPHNLHIFTAKGGTSIAVTNPQAVEPGNTGTLTTTITQPGDYYFQCDFHPTLMTGTLTVK